MSLSKTEEQLMEHIWKKEKVYLKELIEAHPSPKPAATTLATLLKRMQDKGFVGYEVHGNTRQYYALISKADYFSKHFNGIIKHFFNDSVSQFASFFTNTRNLSTAELEELKKIVDGALKRKKK